MSAKHTIEQHQDAVTACVILIGNEILSGRTQDQNLGFLAALLNEHGVQVQECRIIPDIHEVIVETVRACRPLFSYLITTGGIGPTHDDITVDGIAAALNLQVEVHPGIAALLRRREVPEEVMQSRLKMARVPSGAELVHSAVGPPGFRIENVFVLAGVPAIMRSMAQSMVQMMAGGRSMHTRAIGTYLRESDMAKPLGEIQQRHPHISIGSYPFFRDGRYGTNLVLRGFDADPLDTLIAELRAMIENVGGEHHNGE